MRKITEHLLALYIFSVPWDNIVTIPGLGTVARLAGMAVVGATILTVLLEGRFRKPDSIVWLATAFIAVSALSLLWTLSYPETMQIVLTRAQMVASIWVIREVARTREQQQRVLVAFCLGAFVRLISLTLNFIAGLSVMGSGRYSANGMNADGVGMTLVIGLPIAWHLLVTNRRTVRAFSVKAISLLYLVLAPLGVLLTATRGAFLAELVAALIVPLSLAKQSFSSFLRVSAVLAVMIGTVALAAPPAVWDRLGTIPNEVAGGSMSTRREIWTAGLRVFPERPVLGSGAGAYGAAIDTRREFRLKADTVAHNMLIGLLVEQGVVGLALFLALLGACAVVIFTLPDSNRMLWAIVMMAWFVGTLSLSLERWKVTWFLFGMLAAWHDARPLLRASNATGGSRMRVRPAYALPISGAASQQMRSQAARSPSSR